MIIVLVVIAVLLFRVCIAAILSVGLARQDGSGVVFRLRKIQDPARAPRFTRLIPVVDRRTKVNRQVMTLGVPAQDYIVERTEIIDAPSKQPWRVMPDKPAHTTRQGPVGPQDAPLRGPRDAAGRPQDAAGGPQDAAGGLQDAAGGPQDAAHIGMTIAQVQESVEPLDTLNQGNLELGVMAGDAFGLDQRSSESCFWSSITGKGVVAGRVSTIAAAKSRGATKALRESAAGRRMALVMPARDAPSMVSGSDHTQQQTATVERILDVVPRPVGGPAYFGGRDDAAYLRGWDDAVDWIRRGNEAHGPSWGSAAYMTGWQDAVRAIARARRG